MQCTPFLVIDGQEISWDDFGRMLMAFEGWQFTIQSPSRLAGQSLMPCAVPVTLSAVSAAEGDGEPTGVAWRIVPVAMWGELAAR